MTGETKVLLMRLYERTSANGNRYLYGRLGQAKVVAFIDQNAELQYGATAAFDVYLQAAEQTGERPSTAPAQTQAARPRSTPRHSPRPAGDRPADGDGRPFDDELPEQLQ